jgi:DTW domain-containing protein YfiP
MILKPCDVEWARVGCIDPEGRILNFLGQLKKPKLTTVYFKRTCGVEWKLCETCEPLEGDDYNVCYCDKRDNIHSSIKKSLVKSRPEQAKEKGHTGRRRYHSLRDGSNYGIS